MLDIILERSCSEKHAEAPLPPGLCAHDIVVNSTRISYQALCVHRVSPIHATVAVCVRVFVSMCESLHKC